MGLLTSGYFPSEYWVEDYWNDKYWQDYGAEAAPLLTPGYFHSTYFPGGYWNDGYWQNYGFVGFKGEKIIRDSVVTGSIKLDSLIDGLIEGNSIVQMVKIYG